MHSLNKFQNSQVLNERYDTTVNITHYQNKSLGDEYYIQDFYILKGKETLNFKLTFIRNNKSNRVSVRWEKDRFKSSSSKLNYSEVMLGIHLCFESASKEFNLNKLKSFGTQIAHIDGLPSNLKELYITKHGKSKGVGTHFTDVQNLIKETQFVKDITKLLSKYKLEIDRTHVEKLHYTFFNEQGCEVEAYRINGHLGIGIKRKMHKRI